MQSHQAQLRQLCHLKLTDLASLAPKDTFMPKETLNYLHWLHIGRYKDERAKTDRAVFMKHPAYLAWHKNTLSSPKFVNPEDCKIKKTQVSYNVHLQSKYIELGILVDSLKAFNIFVDKILLVFPYPFCNVATALKNLGQEQPILFTSKLPLNVPIARAIDELRTLLYGVSKAHNISAETLYLLSDSQEQTPLIAFLNTLNAYINALELLSKSRQLNANQRFNLHLVVSDSLQQAWTVFIQNFWNETHYDRFKSLYPYA